MNRTAIVITAALVAGCASPSPSQLVAKTDLALLTEWMSGSFTSAAQSTSDPENYRDIHLHLTPIWTERKDGPWLYVEQAAGTSLDKPYRQRVYHLSKGAAKGTAELALFELPGDPLVFAGAWKSPELLGGVQPEDLSSRKECAIALRFENGAFRGSTAGKQCTNSLHAAAYMTSEVVIEESRLVSWDRGFDADGVQKWGTEEGGYVFMKE